MIFMAFPMHCSWLADWVEDLTSRLPTFSLKGLQRPEEGPGMPLDPPRILKYLKDNLPPTELGRLTEALVASGDAIGADFIEAHVSHVTQVWTRPRCEPDRSEFRYRYYHYYTPPHTHSLPETSSAL